MGELAAPPGQPRPLARSLDVVAVGRLPATVPSLGAVARVPLLGTIDPLLEGEVMQCPISEPLPPLMHPSPKYCWKKAKTQHVDSLIASYC